MEPPPETSECILHHYDRSETMPSMAIIDAIAVLEDKAPEEVATLLDPPLSKYIDAGALDRLLANGGSTSVSTRIDKYRVYLDGRSVTVEYG